ncbi:hypothetical protein EV426DRAFT_698975 [Tirmania nivea]|nr:hypothetical protein EV426DRAFT_698975 [Tirmania nivea]
MPPGVEVPNAVLGGIPDRKTDIPVYGVLTALFVINAFIHSRIFKQNKSPGSVIYLLYDDLRFSACPDPLPSLLFIVNLVCAQRIVGALHPVTGLSKLVGYAFKVYYASIIAVLVMVITTTVQSFETTNPSILKTDIDVRKFCGIWMTVFTFSPIPHHPHCVLDSQWIPTNKTRGWEHEHQSRHRTWSNHNYVPLTSTYRITDPGWYHQLIIHQPMLELMVVIALATLRFDQRFYLDGKRK